MCSSDLLYQDTVDSRRETERLTSLKLNAGFVAPADEAQARAGSYDSENQLIAQQGICQQNLNRLAQLSAMPSAELETKLADTPDAGIAHAADRADERRVGKEGVRTCKSLGSPDPK